MTPREWWNQIPLRIVVLLTVAAAAFATMEAQLTTKAEKAEVSEMRQDIKDIKSIICGKGNPDSACH